MLWLLTTSKVTNQHGLSVIIIVLGEVLLEGGEGRRMKFSRNGGTTCTHPLKIQWENSYRHTKQVRAIQHVSTSE